MPVVRVRPVALRGALASVLACTAAFLAATLLDLSNWLSPSSPPLTLQWCVLQGPIFFVLCSLWFSLWLLPGCIVVRRIMWTRAVTGVRVSVAIGTIAGAVAFGCLFFFPSLFEWPPAWSDVARKIPAGVESAFYVVTWVVSFELLTPEPAASRFDVRPNLSLAELSKRAAGQTLLTSAAVAYAAVLGGVWGGFMDFGGDDTYRLDSAVFSPDRSVAACLVTDDTPGGALGHVYRQVYLLHAGERWSPRHRGLLVWQAKHVDVMGLEWASERECLVRAEAGSLASSARYVDAYPRGGFIVRAVAVRAP